MSDRKGIGMAVKKGATPIHHWDHIQVKDQRLADRIENVCLAMEGVFGAEDEAVMMWASELREVAHKLRPVREYSS